MAFNLFCNQMGDCVTFNPLMVIPQYRGANEASSTLTFILNDRVSTRKLLVEGVVSFVVMSLWSNPAFRSRATPQWLMASDRLGVRPISKILSLSTSKCFEANNPGSKLSSKTIIPSASVPNPNSISEQIIPELSSPRILVFLISNEIGRAHV